MRSESGVFPVSMRSRKKSFGALNCGWRRDNEMNLRIKPAYALPAISGDLICDAIVSSQSSITNSLIYKDSEAIEAIVGL